MKKTVFATLICMAVLSGCAGSPARLMSEGKSFTEAYSEAYGWDKLPVASEKPIRPTTVTRDEFRKQITYKSQPFFDRSSFQGNGTGVDAITLAAIGGEKAKMTIYAINITDSFRDDWRFYRGAYDGNGNEFHLRRSSDRPICGSVGCTLTEYLTIDVSRKYLEAHANTGIMMKIVGRQDEIFTIPATRIREFLAAVPNTLPDAFNS